MKPLAIIAASIVSFALISYSIGILTEQRKKLVSNFVLIFISLGVFLDISSTAMMIIVSENSPFTLHGIMGYSSLTLMLIDAILLWRYRIKNGPEVKVNKPVHLYSRIAYILWVAAYLTGTMLVFIR